MQCLAPRALSRSWRSIGRGEPWQQTLRILQPGAQRLHAHWRLPSPLVLQPAALCFYARLPNSISLCAGRSQCHRWSGKTAVQSCRWHSRHGGQSCTLHLLALQTVAAQKPLAVSLRSLQPVGIWHALWMTMTRSW